jgi:MurNAc alpha-1-phosphate uridylyltransferase
MDVCLLLTRTETAMGFDGPGDFFKDDDGRLTFRGEAPTAPFAYIGAHICKPQIVDSEPLAPFSLARLWRRLAAQGRLHGVVPEGKYSIFPHWMAMRVRGRLHGVAMAGLWMHVGDPAARDAAERRLAAPATARGAP